MYKQLPLEGAAVQFRTGGGKLSKLFFAQLFRSQLTVLHTFNLILMTARQKHFNAEGSGEQGKNHDLCSAPLLPLTMPLLSTFFHHKKPCFPIRASTHCKCKCLTLTLLPYCGTEKVRGSRRPWCLNVCGQWEGTRPFIPLPTFISDRNCACKILNPAGVMETRSSIYFLWSSKNSNTKKNSQ